MHTLTTGVSRCGKSSLAKILAGQLYRKNAGVLVLDPLKYTDWPAHLVTDDAALFLQQAHVNYSCHLFIDESGQTIGRYNPEMEWCTTQSRHWGHSAHLICHNVTQLAPVTRNMVERAYVFQTDEENAEKIAQKFNRPEIIRIAPTLPQFEFIVVSTFKPLLWGKLNVFNKNIALMDFKKKFAKRA